MTTLTVVDGRRPNEPRSKSIARRLRSEIAGMDMSETEAAAKIGVSQPWMSRRLRGAAALTIADIDRICDGLGLSFTYIVNGIKTLPSQDEAHLLLPRVDSNHEPSD